MLLRFFCVVLLLMPAPFLSAQSPAQPERYTLTVVVEGVSNDKGNIGVLVFNSDKGWPEDRFAALRDIVVPAHPGTVTVPVSDLPPGTYAVAVAHDENKNHKLDRNWFGKPKEQWAMSNNPHAIIKAPRFRTAAFQLQQNMEIRVRMQ